MGKFLGYFENEKVFLNTGKYGPFISHMKRTYSVPLKYRNEDIILLTAISIIENKKNENHVIEKITSDLKQIQINDYSCIDKLEILGEKSILCNWLDKE